MDFSSGVEELEEFLQLRLTRKEQAERRETVEEDAEVEGKLVEKAAEEDAIAFVLAAEGQGWRGSRRPGSISS
jgi:hypothetical protein